MTADPASGSLVVRRTIPAPRHEVFAAWLDPESLATWMCPGAVRSTAQVDPRVGGAFRVVMDHAAEQVEHTGTYLAIEPPARLSFTWISPYTDMLPSVVTVEFHTRDDGTEVVLTHERLPARHVDAHRKGWGEILQKLGGVLRR
ncbi:MAG TPA: SRPBCC domain-containing protein [Gemmatimonadales bacterium]|nr:SRPBCC domain-containing protein [Gemmatimonadales bacterium]